MTVSMAVVTTMVVAVVAKAIAVGTTVSVAVVGISLSIGGGKSQAADLRGKLRI